jgi:DNA-nicking Smr family endonuclease
MPKTMKEHLPNVKPLITKNSTIEFREIKTKLPLRRQHSAEEIFRPKRSEFSPLTRKSLRKFNFSRMIDLHGFTQNEAFSALIKFFDHCRSENVKKVLVITGGNVMKESVLRNSFIKWVKDSFGDYVASCSPANLQHGGQGAFYVVLKKSPN